MSNTESDFTDFTIGIVGLGLIGGSYAKGLRNMGVKKIIGVDTDTDTLEQALAEGVIDQGLTTGNSLLREAKILIFCLPATAMLHFVQQNISFFHSQVILTDVSGIKGNTAQQMQAMLADNMDFVPGHPMAGREGKGFGQSDAAIFHDANYILVPQATNAPAHIKLIAELAKSLGCKNIVTVTPEEHDRMIAYTSSLPHVLATALVNSSSMDAQTKYFIAGSFRDGTRVADINAPLWTQLFISNKQNLLEEINRFRASLQDFTDLLMSGEEDKLTNYLQKAALRRRELTNEKHSC